MKGIFDELVYRLAVCPRWQERYIKRAMWAVEQAMYAKPPKERRQGDAE